MGEIELPPSDSLPKCLQKLDWATLNAEAKVMHMGADGQDLFQTISRELDRKWSNHGS